MAEATQQPDAAASAAPARPTSVEIATIKLGGYGRHNVRPPFSSLDLYWQMERDYAIAAALAVRKAPIVSAKWTVTIEATAHELATPDEQAAEDASEPTPDLAGAGDLTGGVMLASFNRGPTGRARVSRPLTSRTRGPLGRGQTNKRKNPEACDLRASG